METGGSGASDAVGPGSAWDAAELDEDDCALAGSDAGRSGLGTKGTLAASAIADAGNGAGARAADAGRDVEGGTAAAAGKDEETDPLLEAATDAEAPEVFVADGSCASSGIPSTGTAGRAGMALLLGR